MHGRHANRERADVMDYGLIWKTLCLVANTPIALHVFVSSGSEIISVHKCKSKLKTNYTMETHEIQANLIYIHCVNLSKC